MGVLVKKVRISNFRGLENIEVELAQTTVLTGMNNSGKTSFLKALQLAFGNHQFISHDDFYLGSNKIVVDILIVPTDENGIEVENFSTEWEELFTVERIKDDGLKSFIPLRTIVEKNDNLRNYKLKKYILPNWEDSLIEDEMSWEKRKNGMEKTFTFEEMPFYYMDAQRDILNDTKLKNSYLGRALAQVEYNPEITQEIEKQMKDLNEKIVSESPVLNNLKETLRDLDSAVGNNQDEVEITPLTKKIRDLNKGLTIQYRNGDESLPMEYHGMGTRSWSSLLTLKSLININNSIGKELLFPILAIEEPEAHLHPQAQKKLYNQLNEIKGQKIISTHSPYICSSANLKEIRNFSKKENKVLSGKIDIDKLLPEDVRKIERQVINTRGELFFSKVVVLFEGETEEQVLPMFAEEYFKKNELDLMIDFIGVGGFGNYYPFIILLESLNIPWVILSDGEKKVRKNVKKQMKKIFGEEVNLETLNNLIILEEDEDFEKSLITSGYIEEIEKTLKKMYYDKYIEDELKKRDGSKESRIKTSEICPTCKQNIYVDTYRNYLGENGYKEALYDIITSQKTKFSSFIAEAVIESGKGLPPKIIEVFKEIERILEISKEG